MDFLNSDVPDPTDFPAHSTAPGLRSLDGSFRCNICGDLYDAPVTIGCGHCFCSLCIRTSLCNKQECPSCRKSATEAQLRPNPILDKIISDWKEARSFILHLLKEQNEASKKRKRSPSRISSPSLVVSGPSLYSNGIKSPTKSKKLKVMKRDIDVTIPSSDAEEIEIEAPTILNFAPNANDVVNCPICETRVKYRKLNDHIDNQCQPSTHSAAKTWSKILVGGQNKGKCKQKGSDSDDEHPLPIQTYATLKDKQLKEMLQQYDLPATGSRPHWEQRHQRWVLLYNSNLDRSLRSRKTKAQLRKDLKKWEEDKIRKKKTAIKDVQGYQVQHKQEFANLVEAARHGRQVTQSQTPLSLVEATVPTRSTSIAATSGKTKFPLSSFINDEIVVDSEDEGFAV